MDAQIADRRFDARFQPPGAEERRATLRPGTDITLIDVSAGGALVQAPRPLRPGARVHLQIGIASRRVAIAAHVLRCAVWSLDPLDGVTYRGALKFDQRVDWQWADPTRRVQAVPEHDGPTPGDGGNRLPRNRDAHHTTDGE